MKHLSKFESFDDFIGDPMEQVKLVEYNKQLNENYQPFTESELQKLTDFCNQNGFIVRGRPKEQEVNKGRFDKFKDFVKSKFGGKKEDIKSPEVSNEFKIYIPGDHPGMVDFTERNLAKLQERKPLMMKMHAGTRPDFVIVKVFKSNEDFIYMDLGIGIARVPVFRDCYRFDYMKTFFDFVKGLFE